MCLQRLFHKCQAGLTEEMLQKHLFSAHTIEGFLKETTFLLFTFRMYKDPFLKPLGCFICLKSNSARNTACEK